MFIAAAILTPPDPITQIGLALPLLLLYELSILTVKMIEKIKMHNIKDIRKILNTFQKIAERNVKLNLKELMDLDKTNRELLQKKKN